MKPAAAAAAAVAAFGLVAIVGAEMKRAARKKVIVSDLGELHELVRPKVTRLLELMRAEGFDPIVWETYRAPERAAELATTGKGKARSMHVHRLAADIIDRKLYWSAPPAFWESLHRNALAVGLYRVNKKDPKTGAVYIDPPHVQGLPGNYDAKVWAMQPAAREAFIREQLAA